MIINNNTSNHVANSEEIKECFICCNLEKELHKIPHINNYNCTTYKIAQTCLECIQNTQKLNNRCPVCKDLMTGQIEVITQPLLVNEQEIRLAQRNRWRNIIIGGLIVCSIALVIILAVVSSQKSKQSN